MKWIIPLSVCADFMLFIYLVSKEIWGFAEIAYATYLWLLTILLLKFSSFAAYIRLKADATVYADYFFIYIHASTFLPCGKISSSISLVTFFISLLILSYNLYLLFFSNSYSKLLTSSESISNCKQDRAIRLLGKDMTLLEIMQLYKLAYINYLTIFNIYKFNTISHL